MAETIPQGRVGTNDPLQQTMIPGTQTSRIGKPGPRGKDGKESDLAGRKQEPDKDFRLQPTDQDFRKRIHGRRLSEEVGGMAAVRGVLIPENAETPARSQMG